MPTEDGRRTAAQYDAMAAGYASFNEVNAANAHYERPATIALLGDVAGKDVLEAGCGAGPLTWWLVEHGATVRAFDVSPEMAALAQARVGDRADVTVRDLHDGLGHVDDASQDIVVASLVVHYLRDWEGIFGEFRRVLRSTGKVVFSTHHPAWDWQEHSPCDYFAVIQATETWSRGGSPFEVTFWRRPLGEMTRVIAQAGFAIESIGEPEPLPELAGADPEADSQLRTRPFFLFFCLRPRPLEWG
ncbi:MAG: class I SAM-dependent methyltransferase [Acidimicrobiales bacterium]